MISLEYSSTFYKSVLFCCAALRIDLILTLWNLYLAISENFSDAMESTICDLNTTPPPHPTPPKKKTTTSQPFWMCYFCVYTIGQDKNGLYKLELAKDIGRILLSCTTAHATFHALHVYVAFCL